MYKGSAEGFKKEHPAALISTLQRAFASQWNQTWQRRVNPGLTPPFGGIQPPQPRRRAPRGLEVNRSDPLREAGRKLPGGKRQSGKMSRISRMPGEWHPVFAKRSQAGSAPAWASAALNGAIPVCPSVNERPLTHLTPPSEGCLRGHGPGGAAGIDSQ